MALRRTACLCALLVLAAAVAAASARAGEFGSADGAWSYWDIRDAIYARESLIAHLQANPDIDDSYKGPLIAAARAEILRLQAMVEPLQPGPTPCCYSRKPIHIR